MAASEMIQLGEENEANWIDWIQLVEGESPFGEQ